ncbi:hypothetical protein SO802_008681 [Lithocarpus litseifolius]|uniref:DUF8040 domain-containing protein n=1 Tax=Lithocarpus litseifolius TaxID=425828 RepID=A0AAW2DC57_9ROSI
MNVEPNYRSSSSSLDKEEDDDMFFMLTFVENRNNYIPKEPQRISMLTGDAFIKKILNGIPRTCYELFRMDMPTFTSLFNYLRTHKFLTNSHWITVEEVVGMFLLIVGHNVRIRLIADRFQHSTEIVDRQFKEIVRAICRLGKFIIPNSFHISRHSSLRNVIERCFGVLKARFPVLKMMPRYKPCRQGNVMRACFTIHNFIRMATRHDRLFTQFNIDNLTIEGEGRNNLGEPSHIVDLTDQAAEAMVTYRDQITRLMLANNRHH